MKTRFQTDRFRLSRFSPVYKLMHKQTLKRLLLCSSFVCLIIFSVSACGTGGSSPSATATVPLTPSATPPPTPTPSPLTSTPTSTPPIPTLSEFKVTSIDMAVSPPSIAELSCGSNITVTYTATFHIAPNGSGGTIQFLYTWNNGHSSPTASVTVDPGQTTATYMFTSMGQLLADQTFPGLGYVMTTDPNVMTSLSKKPDGQCR